MSVELGSVGTAYVELSADLSNLQAGLSNAVQTAGKSGEGVGTSFSKGLEQGLAPIGESLRGLGPLFDGVQESAGTAAKQIGFDFSEASSTVVSSSESMAQAVAASGSAMGASVEETGGYVANLKQSFANFGETLTPALDRLNQFRPALNNFGSAAQGLGTILSVSVTAPLAALAAGAISTFADIDSLKRGLVAVTGSAAAAETEFNSLRDVAKLPGLGLEESVQGAIRLQAFGMSAGEAKTALLAFGNAIATVGGGKTELDRVIVQLGQMSGASKVLTQDLRPIIEQVPQLSGLLKKEFGPDILGQPEKTLEKLGISSKEFIDVMVRELGKLPPVTGGIKNDLENMSDAIKISLADIGKSLAPAVASIANVFVPALQGMVAAFTALPIPLQDVGIGLAAVAAAAGPVLFIVGGVTKGFSDLIGLAHGANEVLAPLAARMFATADAEVALGTAGTTAVVGLEAATVAEVHLGEAAVTTEAELVALKGAIAEASGISGFGIAIGAIADTLLIPIAIGTLGWILMHPEYINTSGREVEALSGHVKDLGNNLTGVSIASHGLTDQNAAYSMLTTSLFSMATGASALSKGAQDLINKSKELRAEYDTSVKVYNDLLAAQRSGVDVGNSLALAHDKMTKALAALNPQIKENEAAQKKATEALRADSEVRNKADADAIKIFDEAKKNLSDLEALNKSGVVVTDSLKKAKDDLSAAFISLNKTIKTNAEEQLAANAETSRAAEVSARQQEEQSKLTQAARQYVAAMQAAAANTLDHEIALNRVVGVLKDGVTYIHSFTDAQVEAAKAGTLTWKQIQDSVGGVTTEIKKVPIEVDKAGAVFVQFGHGVIADLGEVSGSIQAYANDFGVATTEVTNNLAAVRILRGEGVQHIETLADEIGKMGKQWVSATEALYGTRNVIPQWVKDNTIAIQNGIRIVSDAAIAAHEGYAAAANDAAAANNGLVSSSDAAAAGYDKVAASATRATQAAKSFSDESLSAIGDSASSGSSGAWSKGGSIGSWSMGGGQNDIPNVGDISHIDFQNATSYGHNASTLVSQWTAAQVQLVELLSKTMPVWAAKIRADGLSDAMASTEMAQATKEQADAAKASAPALTAVASAVTDTKTSAIAAKPTLEDLTDQLWRLIDAGQSNSQAAMDLRTQIAGMTTQTTTLSNAYADAASSAKAMSAAVSVMAQTTVAAATATVQSAARTAAVAGITVPTVPNAPLGSAAPVSAARMAPTDANGKLLVPIYIQAQSPEAIGAQVTQIIRNATGQ